MKKISILLILASLFIGFVMFHLLKEGVRLQERKMIKWSTIASVEDIGPIVAQHIYPMIKNETDFLITSESDEAQKFFASFQRTLSQEQVTTQVHLNNIPRGYMGYILKFEILKDEGNSSSCQQGDKLECLKGRAYREFRKKNRDETKLWIQMWRVSEKEMVLFIH